MAAVQSFMVGMSDLHCAKGPATFTCLGLGSCIGLIAFDPVADVTGVVHIMLPEAFKDKPVDKIGKFADIAVPALIAELTKMGAIKSRLVVAYAGGAQVFKFGANADSRLDVGSRNSKAVEAILAEMGIKPIATETGGTNGRTVTVDTVAGSVKVRSVHTGDQVLCNLRTRVGRVAA